MSGRALARLALTTSVAAALSGVLRGAGPEPSRADANSLKQKVAGITAFGERPSARLHRTTVTEDEVNAYLALDAHEQLPAGVVDPAITIVGTGRVSARAVVDLDVMKRQRSPRGLLDPMTLVGGRLQVTASGRLKTSDGIGRFELESAHVASIPIPKVFLQEIVSYYSRTAEKPSGIALDDPFALPARIREIQVEAGRAVIVQ